ncbi:MAG: type IV toxin-antitoxin system AbiEi family antitoxin domain-containing protein [Solirubrobacterales bacterium]
MTRFQGEAALIWALVDAQHGVVARWQLAELGLSLEAVRHRVHKGRLHRVYPGVYAVGRPQLAREGRWFAAVLACGRGALLSHASAGALWRLTERGSGLLHVSVGMGDRHRPAGVVVHQRRESVFADATHCQGIPVTSPLRTLLDCGLGAGPVELERMVNRADERELLDPDAIRAGIERMAGERGVRRLRALMDRQTFALTDSELEGRFRALLRRHSLPQPLTRQRVNGFRVDFHWPELGLVVETDGLRYHRTPAQQLRDRRRDQAHAAAGIERLRFTHAQVRFESGAVASTMSAVIERLRRPPT